MPRRKKTLAEIVIDFLRKEGKNKEGENPMFPYGQPIIMMPPQGQSIDPLSLHKFITDELQKQEKEAKDKAEREKNKDKPKWFFKKELSYAQTVLCVWAFGLFGGLINLKLLTLFKASLLQALQ